MNYVMLDIGDATPITVYNTGIGFDMCAALVSRGIILFRYEYYYYILMPDLKLLFAITPARVKE